MCKIEDLGRGIRLLRRASVPASEISQFFVIAHGVQAGKSTVAPPDFEIYFPWGMGNFGWYESDVGFDLQSILENKRRGVKEGQTQPTRICTTPIPNHESHSPGAPLLLRPQVNYRDIQLAPDDLNPEFCKKMLKTYYLAPPRGHVGILCIEPASVLAKNLGFGQSSILLSVVLNVLRQKIRGEADVICLCCSHREGQERDAELRSVGYVALDDGNSNHI